MRISRRVCGYFNSGANGVIVCTRGRACHRFVCFVLFRSGCKTGNVCGDGVFAVASTRIRFFTYGAYFVFDLLQYFNANLRAVWAKDRYKRKALAYHRRYGLCRDGVFYGDRLRIDAALVSIQSKGGSSICVCSVAVYDPATHLHRSIGSRTLFSAYKNFQSGFKKHSLTCRIYVNAALLSSRAAFLDKKMTQSCLCVAVTDEVE